MLIILTMNDNFRSCDFILFRTILRGFLRLQSPRIFPFPLSASFYFSFS